MEYLEKTADLSDYITRSKLREMLLKGNTDEIEKAWKAVEAAGGYEALED